MPLFNYGRTPGYAPGGRGINPETARIGDMPGGMDFLAGYGPAPAGVTDWTDPAIIHNKRLAGSATMGTGTPLNSFLLGLQRWGNPASNGQAIGLYNARHQTNLTPQQLGVQVTSPAGVPQTPQAPMPQANFQTGTATKPLSGVLGSFNTQWTDQNDPGGFIRKFQAQQASQPWAPNLGGVTYGVGTTSSMGG